MKNKFSIITVCLNEKNLIRRTCESIIEQTFSDFEWIVIDGASTDGTLDILNEYKDRIRLLLSESDSGIFNAMNKGLMHATGNYVNFMNGGDCFAHKDVLQVVSTASDCDIIYGDVLFDKERAGEKKCYPDDLPKDYFLKNMLPHQASFYRRNLFEKYGKYNESYNIAGDYELFVRLVHRYKVTTFHIPQVLARFNLGGISCSSKHRALRKKENHRVRLEYFPRYRLSFKGARQTLRNYIKNQGKQHHL